MVLSCGRVSRLCFPEADQRQFSCLSWAIKFILFYCWMCCCEQQRVSCVQHAVGGAAVNRGPLSVHYTVCTSGGSCALWIKMPRRSEELAFDTALPWILSNTPDKCEALMSSGQENWEQTRVYKRNVTEISLWALLCLCPRWFVARNDCSAVLYVFFIIK